MAKRTSHSSSPSLPEVLTEGEDEIYLIAPINGSSINEIWWICIFQFLIENKKNY